MKSFLPLNINELLNDVSTWMSTRYFILHYIFPVLASGIAALYHSLEETVGKPSND